ncbi:unnamed protein product [Toxocara canis]|uniref:Pecanex-like protein n=1 Tax=Toxocara canis TaxID=6265 RepID=A0A183V9D0_TOXCA|nr:unnamed protein product [Toxocara canis]
MQLSCAKMFRNVIPNIDFPSTADNFRLRCSVIRFTVLEFVKVVSVVPLNGLSPMHSSTVHSRSQSMVDDMWNVAKQLRRPGIEPGPPAWQASILPLNHRRV